MNNMLFFSLCSLCLLLHSLLKLFVLRHTFSRMTCTSDLLSDERQDMLFLLFSSLYTTSPVLMGHDNAVGLAWRVK